jgi:hypothetical protein
LTRRLSDRYYLLSAGDLTGQPDVAATAVLSFLDQLVEGPSRP